MLWGESTKVLRKSETQRDLSIIEVLTSVSLSLVNLLMSTKGSRYFLARINISLSIFSCPPKAVNARIDCSKALIHLSFVSRSVVNQV